MTLQYGGHCLKYLLIPFNLLFVITGIILIVIGAVIKTPYSAYHYILDHGFFAIPVLLVFVGVITFMVSFFGCYGALKESYCMVITFGVLMVLVFILEISAGIAGYVLRDNVSDALKSSLIDEVQHYNTTDVKRMWDLAQSNFKCCGAMGPNDWNNTVPKSCCSYEKEGNNTCKVYTEGCYIALKNFFTSNAGTLGGAGIGIAVIQVLGILFSYGLATSIRKQYESLEKN